MDGQFKRRHDQNQKQGAGARSSSLKPLQSLSYQVYVQLHLSLSGAPRIYFITANRYGYGMGRIIGMGGMTVMIDYEFYEVLLLA